MDEHVPTAQETAIYDALTAGDHEAIEEMRQDAHEAGHTPDEGTGLTPVQQFEQDQLNAWTRYQADHEAPEEEREENSRAKAEEHNDHARGKPPKPKPKPKAVENEMVVIEEEGDGPS